MKYILYILLLILIASCDMHKQFHKSAYLSKEEVVFENVEMLKQGMYDEEYYISKISSDGTLIFRCFQDTDTGRIYRFFSSSDNGDSWKDLAIFSSDSIYEMIGCHERPSTYMWMENQNTLYSVGSHPDFALNIYEYQKNGKYDAFDKEISPSQVIYKNKDTMLRRFFFPLGLAEKSIDSGETWERAAYSSEKIFPINSNTQVVGNTVVTAFANSVFYSLDFGKTWNKNKQLQQYFDNQNGNSVLVIRNLKKLNSGELFLFMDYLPKQVIAFRQFMSSDGIDWQEIREGRSKYPYLIDKLDEDTYVLSTDEEDFPVKLITKHHTYKLPFPTDEIEYTKSGYWYYYDYKRVKFCRRKIVVK